MTKAHEIDNILEYKRSLIYLGCHISCVGLPSYYGKRAILYLSRIQHRSPEIVCNSKVLSIRDIVGSKCPRLVQSKSFEMNQSQVTYRRILFFILKIIIIIFDGLEVHFCAMKKL
jgi:hypothetical protein